MSQLEELIRDALRDTPEDIEEPTWAGQLVGQFLRRSRWVAAFAWMKMTGTLLICFVAMGAFFGADSVRSQLLWATVFLVGFVGFAMWWLWYWMTLNRNATLREMKRIELQIAELRASRST